MELNVVEEEYQRRIDAMSPAERIARTAAMLAWTREQMALEIRRSEPDVSAERLKWLVALRLYSDEPEIVRLIEKQLEDVSRRSL